MKMKLMKTCLPAYLLIIIVLISSCNYIKNIKLLTGGSLERTDFIETVPFEYNKDLIVVEAGINGGEDKYQFIFDTGAFESKIEMEVAEKMNLPTLATKTNSTAQGISQTIEVTRLESISLGETVFSNISAGKLQYDAKSASKCVAPYGIIGANLMKLAHWKIDYQNREIQFSDRPFKAEDEFFTVDFDKPALSGTPEIEIEVAGKTVSSVLFDVGYNGGLVLPAGLSDSYPTGNKQEYFDRSTSGIFGTNTDTLTLKTLDVVLGEHKMTIPVQFSSIGKALLGNDILEHFEVFIDYDNKHIGLHPRSRVHIDPDYSFIPGILNDSLWVVNRTTSRHPFSLGDTLQSINGYKPAALYNSYCDYFLNINKLLETDSLLIKIETGKDIILNPRI